MLPPTSEFNSNNKIYINWDLTQIIYFLFLEKSIFVEFAFWKITFLSLIRIRELMF